MINALFQGLNGVFFARVNVNKPHPRPLSKNGGTQSYFSFINNPGINV